MYSPSPLWRFIRLDLTDFTCMVLPTCFPVHTIIPLTLFKTIDSYDFKVT